MVQRLRLHTFTAGGTGSIPAGATKIPLESLNNNIRLKKKSQQMTVMGFQPWAPSTLLNSPETSSVAETQQVPE